MATGDDALAAGMALVQGTDDRRNGWQEDNLTRDYIAQRTHPVQPVSAGGTGATTAAGARTALDVYQRKETIRNRYPDSNQIVLYWNGARVCAVIDATDIGPIGAVFNGGTVTGDILLPNSWPAASSYTVAYINGDGRIARGASSARYKDDIRAVDPADLGDLWPVLQSFVMTGDEDRTERIGYIAEHLDAHPDQARFVVYDSEGRPDSIDFIALLIAQNAQLHQGLDLLAQRVEDLEEAITRADH